MEKQCWRILRKLKTELPYDPAIPLLGIYLYKTRIQRDACTPVFIAALFIIARAWKQPTCASTDEWKVWYVLSHFSLLQLFATSSVHGILQAGILEWVTVPSSRGYAHNRCSINTFCTSDSLLIGLTQDESLNWKFQGDQPMREAEWTQVPHRQLSWQKSFTFEGGTWSHICPLGWCH